MLENRYLLSILRKEKNKPLIYLVHDYVFDFCVVMHFFPLPLVIPTAIKIM